MLLSFLSKILLWGPSFCFATDEQEDSPKYECLYLRSSVAPHEEDPFKDRPTTLSPSLLEKIKEKRPEKAEFYTLLMQRKEHDLDKDTRTRVGPFLVDLGVLLGRGEEGDVYLAEDTRSRVFTAVKTTTFTKETTDEIESSYSEYQANLALKRCFGFYCQKIKSPMYGDVFSTYLFVPLIDGKEVHHYQFSGIRLLGVEYNEKENIVKYKNLAGNVMLLRSIVDELRYLHKCGVAQDDISTTNTMFTSAMKFALVDLILTDKIDTNSSLRDDQCNIAYYLPFVYFGLGIRDILDRDNYTLKAVVPQPVMNLHHAIRPSEPGLPLCHNRDFSLAELDKAVTTLEKEIL